MDRTSTEATSEVMEANISRNLSAMEMVKMARAAYERPWVRDEVLVASLTAVSFYLVVVFSIFEWRKDAGAVGSKKPPSSSKKCENFLSKGRLCLFAAVFALMRCLCEQLELRFGTHSDLACLLYQHQLVEFFHTSLVCLYLLLWSRQLKMYKHKALKHLASPFLRFVSTTVIVGYIAAGVATAISYLVIFRLVASPIGCVYDLSTIDPHTSTLPGLLLFIAAIVFQFALLGLLIYPLIKHYKLNVCGCGKASTGARNSAENVGRTVMRLSACATICVLSDFVSCLLLILIHDGITPISLWANVYTINLLVNIVAVAASFVDWRKRFFPFLKQDYKQVATSSAAATTSSSAV